MKCYLLMGRMGPHPYGTMRRCMSKANIMIGSHYLIATFAWLAIVIETRAYLLSQCMLEE